jgi:hypothetical protein
LDSPDDSASTDVSEISGQTMRDSLQFWMFIGIVWNEADWMFFSWILIGRCGSFTSIRLIDNPMKIL